MPRVNTNANYGATGSFSAPPPYSGNTSPIHDDRLYQLNDWSRAAPSGPTFEPPSIRRILAWTNTRSFVALLTFAVTVGLCMTTMPVTYCNDPADPQVRERIREEWSKEYLQHEKQVAEREIVQARWAWEDEQHAIRLREWEQERVQHERELTERAQREEEERMRLGLFWGHVETHQCKTYGMREYSAVLMNLPMSWERGLEACKATPLEIHGIMQMPTSCEDKGHGVVTGRWENDQHEPDCAPYWIWYNDKESPFLTHGCTSPGSGKRRIEQFLDHLPKGSDWREFCATTPARFDGMEFSGAQECFSKNAGAWGYWEIDDANCY